MDYNDKFRWLSLDDALAVVAFVVLMVGSPFILALAKPPVPTDQDAAWHRRHEANSAQCRGQQYLAQCCEAARTDVTCIDADLRRTK